MSDLISRQAAIDVVGRGQEWFAPRETDADCIGFEVCEDIVKGLENLPSADRYEEAYWDGFHDAERANHRWTPVSEGLPDEGSQVLITVRYKGEAIVDIDDYYSYGWDDWGDEVMAWQPLPEPYEGVTE